MRPYDPTAPCPKCGCPKVTERFVYAEERVRLRGMFTSASDDLMLRTCTMCGYQWPEAPLDAGVKEEPK